jgi:hypothetical protein
MDLLIPRIIRTHQIGIVSILLCKGSRILIWTNETRLEVAIYDDKCIPSWYELAFSGADVSTDDDNVWEFEQPMFSIRMKEAEVRSQLGFWDLEKEPRRLVFGSCLCGIGIGASMSDWH